MSGLETVFKERSKFIVLGLTGRTGSGCTSLSDLLTKEFYDFNPPRPKSSSFENDEERKYKIVYDFLNNNWKNFHQIKMSDVVSTFILDLSFDDFDTLYKSILIGKVENNTPELDEKLRTCYQFYHQKRCEAKQYAKDNPQDLYNDDIYDFYFNQLPAFTLKIKKLLSKMEAGSYTKLYQLVGNNIRKSGYANNSIYDNKKIYMFAQRANKLIKILRHRSKVTDESVCVVLDAIRNPYEAFFFRERYSAFYLMSISTDKESRINRLLAQPGISNLDVKGIDNRENPSSLKGEDRFWSLDIQRCIEISDIHLYNPDDGKKFKNIKKLLVKYLSLIMHPGLITPSQDERCMQIAFNAKLNSGCLSRQVGAVVTDTHYAIKSVGWNNVAQGQTPCNLRRVEDLLTNEDESAFSHFEKSDEKFVLKVGEVYNFENGNVPGFDGKPVSYCFKDIKNSIDGEKNQVHTRALHAEENAFLQISKNGGMSINKGKLYTTASPCELCAKKAYQLGIDTVIFIDPYPGIANDHILTCGTKIPKLQLFYGAIGRAYQQIFEPIIPYKDELEIGMNLDIPNKKKILIEENEKLRKKNKELLNQLRELKVKLAETNS
ncbi:TPA: anti-phage dCTP deaminase [Photobacterium damselae]